MAKREIKNANTNGFDKNPQNINRTGLNKKLYSHCIDELKKKGYKPPTKTEYFEMIGMIIAMSEEDLKDFTQKKDNPFWLRLIINDLNNKNTRQKMMSDYRDWLYGKAEQKVVSDNNNVQTIVLNETDILESVKKIKGLLE
jgi:hypothetical protein